MQAPLSWEWLQIPVACFEVVHTPVVDLQGSSVCHSLMPSRVYLYTITVQVALVRDQWT